MWTEESVVRNLHQRDLHLFLHNGAHRHNSRFDLSNLFNNDQSETSLPKSDLGKGEQNSRTQSSNGDRQDRRESFESSTFQFIGQFPFDHDNDEFSADNNKEQAESRRFFGSFSQLFELFTSSSFSIGCSNGDVNFNKRGAVYSRSYCQWNGVSLRKIFNVRVEIDDGQTFDSPHLSFVVFNIGDAFLHELFVIENLSNGIRKSPGNAEENV